MATEIEERLATLEKELAATKTITNGRRRHMPRLTWRVMLVTALVAVVGVSGAAIWRLSRHQQAAYDPVPAAIRKDVDFTIYYPNPSKIPAGFKLDTSSFSSNDGTVIYAVVHGADKLVFSVQAKPSSEVLKDFETKQIPLHSTFTIPLGIATMGAIGQQTVVSIPTENGSWILMTGPGNLKQDELRALFKSLQS